MFQISPRFLFFSHFLSHISYISGTTSKETLSKKSGESAEIESQRLSPVSVQTWKTGNKNPPIESLNSPDNSNPLPRPNASVDGNLQNQLPASTPSSMFSNRDFVHAAAAALGSSSFLQQSQQQNHPQECIPPTLHSQTANFSSTAGAQHSNPSVTSSFTSLGNSSKKVCFLSFFMAMDQKDVEPEVKML